MLMMLPELMAPDEQGIVIVGIGRHGEDLLLEGAFVLIKEVAAAAAVSRVLAAGCGRWLYLQLLLLLLLLLQIAINIAKQWFYRTIPIAPLIFLYLLLLLLLLLLMPLLVIFAHLVV